MAKSLEKLQEKYFHDESKLLHLKAGELLLNKGEVNEKLYSLISGKIKVFNPDVDGELFMFHKSNILGLNSFFSEDGICRMSLIASEDTSLLYINKDDFNEIDAWKNLVIDFLPIIVDTSFKRQIEIYENGVTHLKSTERLKDIERLASLGELSAGVAHELNNAITVIDRGSDYVAGNIIDMFNGSELESKMLNVGMENGRVISSADARKISKDYNKDNNLDIDQLRDYARSGFIDELIEEDPDVAARAYTIWNVGAILHDIKIASKQSKHVINSMRELASQDRVKVNGCCINESIKEALLLLDNDLRKIALTLNLVGLPLITANSGELIQVWTNIIKNAIDAMSGNSEGKRTLFVESLYIDEEIIVKIKDSGPGISDDIRDNIFRPRFTTKKSTHSFGLGLGLAIIQRIIEGYSGTVAVDSSDLGATFTVTIPVGGMKNE